MSNGVNKKTISIIIIIGIILVAGITGGVWWYSLSPVYPEPTTTTSYEDSPFGIQDAPGGGGHGDFTQRALNEGFFLDRSDYHLWVGNHFTNLKAKWTKPMGAIWEAEESILGEGYDFTMHDALIEDYHRSGVSDLNIVVDIVPVRERGENLDIESQNEIYFRNFVRAFVERYDGDNDWGCTINNLKDCYVNGDMMYPSAELIEAIKANPIKFFQGMNEAFPYWIDTGGSIEGYVRYLEILNEEVKQAYSESTIILGTTFVSQAQGSGALNVFKEVVQKMDGQKLFDYVDVHYWGAYFGKAGTVRGYKTPQLNEIRQFLNSEGYSGVGITMLESGTWVHQPKIEGNLLDDQSEKDQANYLIRNYIYSFANGVSLINWNNILDWSDYGGDEGSIYAHMGLISDGYNQETLDTVGIPRLSYYTYKLMTEKVEGCDWDNIQTIQEKDNIYIYKFTKQGKPIWVAWGDYSKIINLKVNSDKVTITTVIPDAENGARITKEATFKTEVKKVNQGSVSISLGPEPVYVEEGEISAPVYEVKEAVIPKQERFPPKGERRPFREGNRPILGKVTFVGENTLTIETRQGKMITISVNAQTQITTQRTRTKSFSDIKPGSEIAAIPGKGETDLTNFTAQKIDILPERLPLRGR